MANIAGNVRVATETEAQKPRGSMQKMTPKREISRIETIVSSIASFK